MIYITIISFIIFFVIFYYLFYNKTEKFENNIYIIFMNKEETKNYLQNDNDNYMKNLTEIDLYARKVKSSQEYISNILSTAEDFPINKKDIIEKCCNNAD